MSPATESAVPSHSNYMVGHTALEAGQSYPIYPSSMHGRERSSFQG